MHGVRAISQGAYGKSAVEIECFRWWILGYLIVIWSFVARTEGEMSSMSMQDATLPCQRKSAERGLRLKLSPGIVMVDCLPRR